MNKWNEAQKAVGNFVINAAEKAGLVTSEFAQAWRESLDAPIDDKIKMRTDTAAQDQLAIEKARTDSLAQINKDSADTLKTLEEDKARAQKGIDSDYEERLDKQKKSLSEARAAFNELRGTAASEAEAAKAGKTAIPGFEGGEGKKSFASFSAAAGIAAGFGGASDKESRQLEIAAQQKDLARKQLAALEKSNAIIERFTQAMSYS
jgi:DNA gyrase/topoisomerase IV subunit A